MNRLFAWALTYSFVALACLSFASPSFAVDRIALVVGNGAYVKVPPLANPPRDAADIAHSLERLGFQVTLLNNVNASDLRKALVDFGHKADGSEIALVFYAGHGIEVAGENWLIPVDAELRSDTDVESEAVSLRSVNQQVAKARQLGLIILDACRNNPFANKMKRSLATRAVERGLARTEPTDNVLVAYSARDGTTADDGTGRNSPFTTALLRHIETPGLEISFLFRRVRDDVMAATKREQQPFVYGSLSREEIYLKPAPPPAAEKAPKAAAVPEDEQFWNAIKTSDVAGLFEEFVKRYPNSSHLGEARERIRALSTQTATTKVASADAQSGTKQRSPSLEEVARFGKLASDLQMKLPTFVIATIKDDVPKAMRNFVGVWVNKDGYEGGGRKAMLIVTDVASDGSIGGHYVWGPPAKGSWVRDVAGSTPFRGIFRNGEFNFDLGSVVTGNVTTMNVALKGRQMIVRPRMRTLTEVKTSLGYFSPLWQLEAN